MLDGTLTVNLLGLLIKGISMLELKKGTDINKKFMIYYEIWDEKDNIFSAIYISDDGALKVSFNPMHEQSLDEVLLLLESAKIKLLTEEL